MKKFVEKMKRFWSLDAKTNGGFTLVELIVVIAILAILAGIAVPAYSGYVEKAEKAADEQLLDTVNTAFAAACIADGTDVNFVNAASMPLDDEKKVDLDQVSPYGDSFKQFYAGNEDSAFNVIGGLYFNKTLHKFVEGYAVTYAGEEIVLSQEAIKALSASTFAEIGAEDLLEEVAALTSWAESDGTSILESLGQSYYNSLTEYLGFNTAEEMFAWLEGDELTDEERDAIVTNGIVLYAADNFESLTTDSISELLSSGNIYNNLNREDKGIQLAQASLVYGLYTSYINSDYYTGPEITETDPVEIVKTASGDSNFYDTYVNSQQGKADMEAYIAAMGVINDSTANSTAVQDVLINGYNNTELIALLQSAMGN